MNLKKIGKVLTSKSVGTGPSSYEKIIYRAAVSQRLRNTALYIFTLRSERRKYVPGHYYSRGVQGCDIVANHKALY